MTAKRITKKTAKKKASKTRKPVSKRTASRVSAKKPAKKTKTAKSGAPKAKQRSAAQTKTTKTTKTGRSKAPTVRKPAKTPRRPAATPKKKTTKKKRRPPLNLRQFRRQLRQKQAELLEAYLAAKGDSRSRESDGTEDYIDYAVNSYDREFLLSLTELEQNQLTLVEEALKRIERGDFGLCVHCEDAIAIKRIEVQPWARYCLRCQELADSGLADEGGSFPSDDDDDDSSEDSEDVEKEVGADEERLIGG